MTKDCKLKGAGAGPALLLITIISFALILSGCGEKSAADYNKEGMAFYENGDFDQARSYLEKATSMDKKNVTFKQNYAMVLIQQGEQENAIKILEETLTEKKNEAGKKSNKYAYRGLGLAYLNSHDYENAVINFAEALKIEVNNEWNTDIRYYLGNAQELAGDTAGAIASYTKMLRAEPENALAYAARARVYRNTGEYEAAKEDFSKALTYDKGSFETYIGLAACCLETGDQAGADEALFQASLLDIQTNEDKYYLGVVHYYQGKFESAEPEMEYALANGITDANFYLAELAMMDGDYETAKTCFTAYSESTVVESPTVCNDMAVCYMNSGDYETAKQWIEKGLVYETSAVRQELLRNEIACCEVEGDLSAALQKLGEYIIAYPEDEGAANEYNWLHDRVS